MGFLDNLKGLFFETETVTTDEGEIEDISINRNVKKEDVVINEVVETVEETVVEEPKKTVFIDANIANPKQEVKRVENYYFEPVEKVVKKETKRDTYEFTPIISPFFGANKDQQVTRVIPEPAKPKKPNKLGTVISPYYGYVEETTKAKKEDVQLESFIEEDIETFSLEDIMSDEIHEEVAEIDEKIEEVTFEDIEPQAFEKEEKKEEVNETVEEVKEEAVEEKVVEETKIEEPQIGEEFIFDEEPIEEEIVEEETEQTVSIKKAMAEYSEEEVFEMSKQPTLFDI